MKNKPPLVRAGVFIDDNKKNFKAVTKKTLRRTYLNPP